MVTGASSGIGEALARRLAERGWRCVLLARREERLRALASELGAEWEVCDVGDHEAVDDVAARIRDRHPALGLLVNNAGIPGGADFLEIEPARLEEVTRTNYLGSVWCTRAFLPALEAARPSHIVNVVSVTGHVPVVAGGPYAASKHAQLAQSRALTIQLRRRGIHVHTVKPGFTATEGFPQTALVRNPLLRHAVATPDKVARHIVGVVEHDRRETFVPAWYRVTAVAPRLVARFGDRARIERGL